MADKSKAGWKLVEQYQMDEVASDEEDDKTIKKAEKRALALIAEEREKKRKVKKDTFGKTTDRDRFRNAPRRDGKSKEHDLCFRCGRKGHWSSDCYAFRKQEHYGRRDRY